MLYLLLLSLLSDPFGLEIPVSRDASCLFLFPSEGEDGAGDCSVLDVKLSCDRSAVLFRMIVVEEGDLGTVEALREEDAGRLVRDNACVLM